jgi:hypothetical protein
MSCSLSSKSSPHDNGLQLRASGSERKWSPVQRPRQDEAADIDPNNQSLAPRKIYLVSPG